MAFCSVCGVQMEEDASFCTYCGNRVAPQVVYVQQPKPKVPGRGMALASMIVGIIGLVYTNLVFLISIIGMSTWDRYYNDGWSMRVGMMANAAIYSTLSILALVFQAIAARKGFTRNMRKVGLITGVVGLVFGGLTVVVMLFM